MDFETMLRFSKEFALVWFFIAFIVVVAWAYWPSNKKTFESMGRLPLEDDMEPCAEEVVTHHGSLDK